MTPASRMRQELMSCTQTTQTTSFAQPLDLIASMQDNLLHSEEMKAVTFDKMKKSKNRDDELVQLREALLTTNHRNTLPDSQVLANRFTGWVSVFFFPKEATAKQLITIVREMFTTFRVTENMATGDKSQFRAHNMISYHIYIF